MKMIIDIDENIFTRLFDNGTEDYAIINDDLFVIAKAIRKGTPISNLENELTAKILEEIDGGTDDIYIRYTDICDRVTKSIKEYLSAKMD